MNFPNFSNSFPKLSFDKFFKLQIYLISSLCTTILFGNVVNSQHSLTLDLNQQPLSKVIDAIEAQSDYQFIFSLEDVDIDRKVSVNIDKGTIDQVMQILFNETTIKYEIDIQNKVLLKSEKNSTQLFEQPPPQKILSGIVVDETGEPLPGVTVAIRGENKGVTSDFDGNYSISIPDNEVTLIFSYVGMTTHIVTVKDQLELDVVMSSKADPLNEVLLTGYQETTEEKKTGSITKIEEKKLRRVASASIVEVLEAIAPGLLVKNSPTGPQLTIRGYSTLNASNTPLIVLNGFPMSEGFDISSLNPEDIESINLLKDAEATALYGVQAANGVVVIQTYDGSSGSIDKIDVQYKFDGIYGLRAPDLNDFQLINSTAALDWFFELNSNGIISTNYITDDPYDSAFAILLARESSAISSEEAENLFENLRRRSFKDEFQKLFLQNQELERHTVSLSGRTPKGHFRILSDYNRNREVHVGNNRENYRLYATLGIEDIILSNLDLDFTYRRHQTEQKLNHFNYDQFTNNLPYETIYDANGNLRNQFNPESKIGEHLYDHYNNLGYLDWTYNKLKEFGTLDKRYSKHAHWIQSALSYELIPQIRFSSRYQYTISNSKLEDWRGVEQFNVRQTINQFTRYSSERGLHRYIPIKPNLRRNTQEELGWIFRNAIHFDFEFKEKGQLFGTLGIEISKNANESVESNLWGIDRTSLQQLPIDYSFLAYEGTPGYTSSRLLPVNQRITIHPFRKSFSDSRIISEFAQFQLRWNRTYDISASWRVDRTNFFGTDPKNRRAPFASVGSGWIISNEPFLKDIKWVNHLKLRASYGFNGRVASREGEVFIARENTFGIIPQLTGELELFPSTLPNPRLRWERVGTTNVGVDFRLMNYRLGGSLEYYSKIATDLLSSEDIDPTLSPSEITQQYVNVGEVKNQGIDFNLNIRPIENNRFLWEKNINLSWQNSKIRHVNTPRQNINLTSGEGILFKKNDPVDALYVYKSAGLSPEGNLQFFAADDGRVVEIQEALGNIVLEQSLAGVYNPKYYGGITNNFRYKNFTFSFRVSYQLGHMLRGPVVGGNSDISALTFNSIAPHINRRVINRWQVPGDELHTDIPRLNDVYADAKLRYFALSDRNVDRADFVRLRDVVFGYNIPTDRLKRVSLKQLELKVQLTNLWLWTANKWGIDPEYHGSNTSFSISSLAPPPSITFSLNAQF